ERPKPTVRVNPQSSVYTGDTVTLSCELQQGTGWEFHWYKNNQRLQNLKSEQANTLKMTVDNAGETEYQCQACRRNYYNNCYYTEYSDPVKITMRAEPKATVRVNPQSSVYTGDTVTLSCELQQETGWEFHWYKNNQLLQNLKSEQADTLNVTDDNAGETEYRCRANRINNYRHHYYYYYDYYYTELSDPVKITVRGMKISARIKGKVYRTVVRAAMLYGLETVSLRKRQESELEVAELKMLRFSLGVTRLDRIRNEYIRGTAHVGRLGDKVREARLRWFGHVQRREKRPRAVLSVSPQSWLTEGDSVTLSCEVTDSSTDWTFSWYTVVPYRDGLTGINNNRGYSVYVELLSDSSRGSGGNYTLSPAALNHTGVYMCRGERGEPAFHTQYSNPQPLWITGESPPVSLIINPNRTQRFTKDSLSLSCEDQSKSTGWTVRRYTHSERVLDCSHWGSVTGSTCNISFLSTSYTGVYWCESESGENSNPVNITVHGYTIMGKTADLTVVQKTIIDTLHKEDKPQTFIAKEAGCSQSAVSKHVNRKLSGRKKCGRKRCTTNRENRSLMRIVKQNPFKNLSELHKEWTEAGVKASRATTHRCVKEFGYSCRIPLVKPLLNHRQRQRRLTWAKEKKNWIVAQWSKVLFSDESKFCISFGNQGPRVWRKGGEAHSPSCLKSSVKFPQSVMIWDGDVILESPVHPVTEGLPLTLRCLYHNPNPSNLRADFYKDGSVLQNQTTGEMIIQTVSNFRFSRQW
ncbi:hypothetical protein QTP86_020294, partial [Hemibagrus guttatus]